MSFWKYRGRCSGRVIHFLYHYAGMGVAEHAIIGPDFVEYRGKLFASYTWSNDFGKADVPIFTFLDDEDFVRKHVQTRKQQEAISDGCAYAVSEEGRIPVDVEILKVLLDKQYWSADIFCHGIHKVQPKYFIRTRRLFMEAKGWIYAWLPEVNGWMVWVEGKNPPSSF